MQALAPDTPLGPGDQQFGTAAAAACPPAAAAEDSSAVGDGIAPAAANRGYGVRPPSGKSGATGGTGRRWYFAFGSNLDPGRMVDRGAHDSSGYRQRRRGRLDGYRLSFEKSGGYCTVVPGAETDEVFGALCVMPPVA